jgi:hypothetical protein
LGALPSSFFLPVLLAQGTWMWESNDDTLVIESAFSCFGVAGSSSQGLCGWFVLIASEFLMVFLVNLTNYLNCGGYVPSEKNMGTI